MERDKTESNEVAPSEGFNLRHELGMLVYISVPSVAIQFSLFFVFPQSASLVGRSLGTEELAGFSLGSLVGNLTCLSVMVGALSAADTLMPRAYGAGRYDELGRLAIRATVVCAILLIPPIIPLCTVVDPIFRFLGQDPIAAQLAASWLPIYLLGTPANLGFRVIQRFLVAQHKPWPPVYASVIPSFLIHPFLLRHMVARFGLEGSALAIAMTQWNMLFLLLLYLRFVPGAYLKESWNGSWSSIKDALAIGPARRFVNLSLGGVLSLTEWWIWEIMCFIAGSFGVEQLCAHTIAYNLIPLLFMIPLGTSTGLSVRMGTVLAIDPKKAAMLARWTMGIIATLGAILGIALFWNQLRVIAMFTADPVVVDLCQQIWGYTSYYVFMLYIFGINSAILRALGLQWRLAAAIFINLWCLLLPAVVLISVVGGGGLVSQWLLLPIFYTLLQITLVFIYTRFDWNERSAEIREAHRRSLAEKGETTALLRDVVEAEAGYEAVGA